MTRAIEQLMAELATLAATARRTLERGEVPDLAPLARGIERLGQLTAEAAGGELAGLRLRFAALTDELAQLAQAAAASLARTSAAIAATQAHHQAIAAYSHAASQGRAGRDGALSYARSDGEDPAGRSDRARGSGHGGQALAHGQVKEDR